MQKEKLSKNLRNGTNSLGEKEKNFLSGDEICSIIEVCAKRGVGEFVYGPLSFNFGTKKDTQPARNGAQLPENVIQEQQKIEETTLLSEELRTKEEQIAELLITDPLYAEELIVSGELDQVSEEDEE